MCCIRKYECSYFDMNCIPIFFVSKLQTLETKMVGRGIGAAKGLLLTTCPVLQTGKHLCL